MAYKIDMIPGNGSHCAECVDFSVELNRIRERFEYFRSLRETLIGFRWLRREVGDDKALISEKGKFLVDRLGTGPAQSLVVKADGLIRCSVGVLSDETCALRKRSIDHLGKISDRGVWCEVTAGQLRAVDDALDGMMDEFRSVGKFASEAEKGKFRALRLERDRLWELSGLRRMIWDFGLRIDWARAHGGSLSE